MRTWIEKLSDKLEKEGLMWQNNLYSPYSFKLNTFEISHMSDSLVIRNNETQASCYIKLSEEENALIINACKKCEKKTSDELIKQLNNIL